MVYFKKTQPAPPSLAIEKCKGITSGSYRETDVLELVRKDFFDKCYICEAQSITAINVEHFEPHRDTDINKKFDWNNLFWSCLHCNGIKSHTHVNLLNCTEITDKVDQKIKYDIDPMANPHSNKIIIEPIDTDHRTINTVILLQLVYQGTSHIGGHLETTPTRKFQASAIREKLFNEILKFELNIKKYFMTELPEEQEDIKLAIIKGLKNKSQFTAFKRFIVRSNSHYFSEFQQYIIDN